MEHTKLSSSSQPCFFLSMPREIRDEIYSYLVPQPPVNHRRIWLNLPSQSYEKTCDESLSVAEIQMEETPSANAATSIFDSNVIDLTQDEVVDLTENSEYGMDDIDDGIASNSTYESSILNDVFVYSSVLETDSDDEGSNSGNNPGQWYHLSNFHETDNELTRTPMPNILDMLLVNHQIHAEFMETFSRAANISLYVRIENTAEAPYTFTFDQEFRNLPYLRSVRRLFIIAEWHAGFGPDARDYVYGPEDPSYAAEHLNPHDPLHQATSRWPFPKPPYFVFNNDDSMTENAKSPHHIPPLLRKMPIANLPDNLVWNDFNPSMTTLGDDREPSYDTDSLNESCLNASAAQKELTLTIESLLNEVNNVTGLDVCLKLTGYAYGAWKHAFDESAFLAFRPSTPRVVYLAKTFLHGDEIIRRKEETFIGHLGLWQDYMSGSVPFWQTPEDRSREQDWTLTQENACVMKRYGPDEEWMEWVYESP